MCDGNKNRDPEVFHALFKGLLSHYNAALKSKAGRRVIDEVNDKTIKLIDSTSISLCLSMFD